ncbi:hypothetical protein [Sulfurirhabdus autotrophica]|uniref:Uncharacterized protein n=1 Tax=Sulfurirhabdus autotrophica TaxID=1706046 RepID=A0A4V2W0N8_9PROT|nr:hypothetical protein [Sulfurirhabdus autotrophica]TCV78226.1 hypothetical protein EDC63_1429 [Sulfurirhabdus autotrophica]
MKRYIRHTIFLLVITLVINVGGWTFNKEAVADLLLDEQQSVALDNDQSVTSTDTAKLVTVQTPCNHWCHVVGNLMGLLSYWSSDFPVFTNGQIPYSSPVIAPSPTDGQFRPPRAIS